MAHAVLKQYKKYPLTKEVVKKSRLLELAGDQTRIRILCMMFQNRKACVSDIASSLEMSVAAISHHLQIMRDNGLLITEKIGNIVCYIIVDNEFTRKLERIICE